VLSAPELDARELQPVMQERLAVPVALASCPSAVDGSGIEGDGEGLREQWPQVVSAAAAALPSEWEKKRMLLWVPGRIAALCTPKNGAGAVLGVYLVALALLAMSMRARAVGLEAEAAAMKEQKRELQQTLDARRAEREKRTESMRRIDLLLRIKQQGAFASKLLAVVNNARPADVVFRSLVVELEPAPCRVTLKGMAKAAEIRQSLGSLSGYIGRLRQEELLEEVALTHPVPADEEAGEQDGEGVRFELRATAAAPWQEGSP
jgi:hypothetical protein